MKILSAFVLFIMILQCGCSVLRYQEKTPNAILRVDSLMVSIPIDTAMKLGLAGIPVKKSNDNVPFPTPVPSILTSEQARELVSFLKNQKGTKIIASDSIVFPSGKTAIVRSVSELVKTDSKNSSDEETDESDDDIIDFGDRFEVRAQYNPETNIIDLCVDPQYIRPLTIGKKWNVNRLDNNTELMLKNGQTAIIAQNISDPTHDHKSPSSHKHAMLHLVSATKIGAFDLSLLKQNIRDEQEEYEEDDETYDEEALVNSSTIDLTYIDDDPKEVDEQWADEYASDAPNPHRQLVELNILCVAIPLNLTPFWTPPPHDQDLKGFMTQDKAAQLFSYLVDKQGGKIVYSNSTVTKSGMESVIRNTTSTYLPQYEDDDEPAELGIIIRVTPLLSETAPKTISFEFNPVYQFCCNDLVTALTFETALAIPDGQYLILENGGENVKDNLLFFISAKQLPNAKK